MKLIVGDSFHVPSGPAHDPLRKHLMFVANVPCTSNGELFLVPLCGVYRGSFCDSSCLLSVGDHPFIDRDSFMHYGQALGIRLLKLAEKYASGTYKRDDPLRDDAHRKFCQGLLASPHSSLRLKKLHLEGMGQS